MRSAKCRKDVVQLLLVRDVYNCKLERDSLAVRAPEQVVGSHTNVEDVPRRDSRRVVIVVCCSREGYLHAGGAVLSEGQIAYTNQMRGCRNVTTAEEAHLMLLVGG